MQTTIRLLKILSFIRKMFYKNTLLAHLFFIPFVIGYSIREYFFIKNSLYFSHLDVSLMECLKANFKCRILEIKNYANHHNNRKCRKR